jgi:hypothetical protein
MVYSTSGAAASRSGVGITDNGPNSNNFVTLLKVLVLSL